MRAFDHSKIASSIYTARAIQVREILLDMLRLKTYQQPSFLQEIRLTTRPNEYLFTSPKFLQEITSHTLLPHLPQDEVNEIVSSDSFNISVRVRPLDNRKRDKRDLSTFLLATLEDQKPDFPSENYVGLPEEWFERKRAAPFENLVVLVDPVDVYHWKNYEKTLRESLKTTHKNSESNTPSYYNFFSEQALASAISEIISKNEY
ncbi:MAG: hypothetical protein GTN36_00135, partial [Candidatus Aenigmarchaeota archaeon]|nr:hypothetical protein [Candidatus Aenigmarchaeota archaeon]